MSKSAPSSASPTGAKQTSNRSKARGIALDGIVLRRGGSAEIRPTAQVVSTSKAKPRKPEPSQNIHDRMKRSLTLMRRAVPRPKLAPAVSMDIKRIKNHTPGKWSASKKATLPKPNPERIKRAMSVKQHGKVSRFGSAVKPFSQAIIAPVKPAVAKLGGANRSSSPPRPAVYAQSTTMSVAAVARPITPNLPKISHQKLEAMLDKALAQADAHKKILNEQNHRSLWRGLGKSKLLTIGIAALILGVASVGFAYVKIPQFAIKVASLRAGVAAAVPQYVPSGYSLGGTSFGSGTVSLKYTNGKSTFTVTQQKSGLNSESLKDTVISPQDKSYQISQYDGVNVYTYEKKVAAPTQTTTATTAKTSVPETENESTTDAAWVNHGEKVTISNDGSLSTDEIGKIAQSLLSQ